MIPLPYATKDNYKVMLYRLCDVNPEKVGFFFYHGNYLCYVLAKYSMYIGKATTE